MGHITHTNTHTSPCSPSWGTSYKTCSGIFNDSNYIYYIIKWQDDHEIMNCEELKGTSHELYA